ncbi:hypothetical protein AYI70_g722 [Smittium culicis]|uniref:Succinylglutamate desuccinylase/Aspartoacylase catalytic domain-containing protein n=2 Tax=Smittium culicis TaxID=133412 RepID=A0A1R1YFM1_9FUNG|nr:hypothetical protein AYI70_g722 [Smittium culicis]
MKISIILSAIYTVLPLSVFSETVYTGDVISGHKVISKLDISDLPSNSLTKLWLRMTKSHVGQHLHVPILVAKGASDGKRIVFNSGIHGDELNGIRVVQRVFKDIDTSKLKGAVIGIPGSNVNGLYNQRREFYSSFESGILTNLNRRFPGNSTARLDPDKYVSILWDNIYNTNKINVVCDFHTQTSNYKFPNFVYADYRVPYVKTMAELTGADIIKIDDGTSAIGSIEVVNDNNGRPSITYELGSPLLFQKDQIQRAYDYSFRLMADLQLYPPTTDKESINSFQQFKSKTFSGNAFGFAQVDSGGFVERYVDLLEPVKKGQVVGSTFNVFGDKIKDIINEYDGIVTSIGTSPLVIAGDYIINTIYSSNDPKCSDGGC